MIVKTIRLSVCPKSTQEAVRLDFFRLDSLRRNCGETMRHWTRRFTLQYSKVGQALNTSNSEISKDFMLENIRGILLAVTSGLTSGEFASVFATSGTTGAEGQIIGNSWTFSHILWKLSVDNRVMLRWQRDVPRPGNLKQLWQLCTILTCLDYPRQLLALKMEFHGITDPQIVEYEDDDDDYYEEDVDWYTGDCDDELDETTYTFVTPTPDLKCRHRQVAVLKKHVSFWLVSRVPEAMFLLLALVPLTAWLTHPLIENLQSLVAKAGRVRGKHIPLPRKVENRQAWVHLALCQNHRPHVLSLVL